MPFNSFEIVEYFDQYRRDALREHVNGKWLKLAMGGVEQAGEMTKYGVAQLTKTRRYQLGMVKIMVQLGIIVKFRILFGEQ